MCGFSLWLDCFPISGSARLFLCVSEWCVSVLNDHLWVCEEPVRGDKERIEGTERDIKLVVFFVLRRDTRNTLPTNEAITDIMRPVLMQTAPIMGLTHRQYAQTLTKAVTIMGSPV